MSKRETTLIKEYQTEGKSDKELMQQFYDFLTWKRMGIGKKKAFSIIYYLQEHIPVFPDHIEQCSSCGILYDSYSQGHHSELTEKFYCSESCEPPGLWEKERRAERKQLKKAK